MTPPLDQRRPTDPASSAGHDGGSAKDVVLFTGTPAEVKAYCEQNFGPDDGTAVVVRTPQDLDAFFGLDLDPQRCAPSS